jgi:hypothetical protein
LALKTETLVGLPNTVGSREIVIDPLEISAGLLAKILICAQPPGGAVSLEI